MGNMELGKTTCSRIFARALNCPNKTKDGDACGKCSVCTKDIETSMFYNEYDSAMTGNVSDIKELKNSFYFNKGCGYKVIVLDEAQLMTPQAQSALLKVLEDSIDAIFFILCTTNIDKLLPTIKSRSLRLKFTLVPDIDIKNNILNILQSEHINMSEGTMDLIIRRCNGHLRDAHMMIDQYKLLGEERFIENNKSAVDLFYKLIIASLRGDFKSVEKIVELLLCFPIHTLKNDYEMTVLSIIKTGIRLIPTTNQYLSAIVKCFKGNIFLLIDKLNSEVIYGMFTSDIRIQSAMFLLAKDIYMIRK